MSEWNRLNFLSGHSLLLCQIKAIAELSESFPNYGQSVSPRIKLISI